MLLLLLLLLLLFLQLKGRYKGTQALEFARTHTFAHTHTHTHKDTRIFIPAGMSSLVSKDIELHAVGCPFEPNLTAGCVCTFGSALVVWPGVLFQNSRDQSLGEHPPFAGKI